MNRCWNGGRLINGETPLPEDLSDYCAHEELAPIGCNRLFCRDCEHWVKSAPGFSFAEANMEVNFGEIYDLPDFTSAPQIVRGNPTHRLYICRCRTWLERWWSNAYVEDPDPATEPTMNWRCGRHPPLYLPGDIDGLTVERESDLGPLTERALRGFAPPGAHKQDAVGGAWVARLYARLIGSPAADIVDRTAAVHLRDPDAAVRERAIHFYYFFPTILGVQLICDILEGDRSLYAGVPGAPYGWRENDTLEESLYWAVGSLIGKNERVTELARKEVLTPGKGKGLYHLMMELDGPWILEHAVDVARANPDFALLFLRRAFRMHSEGYQVLLRLLKAKVIPVGVWAAFADVEKLEPRDRQFLAQHLPEFKPN